MSSDSAAAAAASPASSPSPPLLYDLTLVTPWFELTQAGSKTFEGRLNRQPARFYKPGDLLRIRHAIDTSRPVFYSRVLEIKHFATFEHGLKELSLTTTLPGIDSIEDGIQIYKQFYNIELQQECGIIFIRTERIHDPDSIAHVPLAMRRISLWLQSSCDSTSFRHHQDCIDRLSKQFQQPTFEPHITLGGFTWPFHSEWTLEEIKARIAKAVERLVQAATPPSAAPSTSSSDRNEFSFEVEFESVAMHPQACFMVLFELMKRTPELLYLRQSIWDELIDPMRRLASSQPAVAPIDPTRDFPPAWPFTPHLSLLYDQHNVITGVDRLHALDSHRDLMAGLARMRYTLDSIQLVLIDTNDYSNNWKVIGSVPIPNQASSSNAASSQQIAIPPPARIPTLVGDRHEFQRQVVDRLNKTLFGELADSLLAAASTAASSSSSVGQSCLIVVDGQVIAHSVHVGPSDPPSSSSTSIAIDRILVADAVRSLCAARKGASIVILARAPDEDMKDRLASHGFETILFARASPNKPSQSAPSSSSSSIRLCIGPIFANDETNTA